MMKKGSRRLLISALALSALGVQAAPVTVVEVSEAGATSMQPRALSAQNEMFFMLQQLQDEVRALRGIIEQQQYRLDQLEQQQRDRYRDMDKRIGLLYQQLPEGSTGLSLPAVAASEGRASPETVQPQEQALSADGGQAAGEAEVYEAAFAKVRARDFATAEIELKAFIADYPASALQANAWYWLGEVYLAQQRSADATAAFTRVVDNFSQHGKAADALYKLGVLSGRSGDAAKARQLMQRVVQEYPQAPAADLARGYLKP